MKHCFAFLLCDSFSVVSVVSLYCLYVTVVIDVIVLLDYWIVYRIL